MWKLHHSSLKHSVPKELNNFHKGHIPNEVISRITIMKLSLPKIRGHNSSIKGVLIWINRSTRWLLRWALHAHSVLCTNSILYYILMEQTFHRVDEKFWKIVQSFVESLYWIDEKKVNERFGECFVFSYQKTK